MKIALFADTEGVIVHTVKPAVNKFNEKLRKVETVQRPVFLDIPGRQRVVISDENAKQNGFESIADALQHFKKDRDAGRTYFYSMVLLPNQWSQMPTYLLSYTDVLSEIKQRTERPVANGLKEKEARAVLDELRKVAGQVVTKDAYAAAVEAKKTADQKKE